MSSINVNYMTQTYSNFAKAYAAKNTANQNMKDTLSAKLEGSKQTTETSAVSGTGEISAKDMTMEEYQAYIADKISRIPVHPSQALCSVSIQISDKGFEAMKNDPEYEKWVLDTLEYDFAFHDPWSNICGGSYSVHYFGASKEEYRGIGWYEGYQNGNGEKLFDEKSKDSFWTRKTAKKNQMELQYKKQQEKRRLQKEADEKAFFDKRRMKAALSSYELNFTMGEGVNG